MPPATNPPSPPAALAAIKAHLGKRRRQEARGLAHKLMDDPANRQVGMLCSAVVALAEGVVPLARALFAQVPRSLMREHAPTEYLRILLEEDPVAGIRELEHFLDDTAAVLESSDMLGLATRVLELGRLDAAGQLVSKVRKRFADPLVAAGCDRLEALVGRVAGGARLGAAAGASPDTPLAVVDQAGLVDWHDERDLDLLVCLLQLVKHSSEPSSAETQAMDLRAAIEGFSAQPNSADVHGLEISVLDRFSGATDSWLESACVLLHGLRIDAEFSHRLPLLLRCPHCVVLALEVVDPAALTDDVIAWLRRCGPIGCSTWSTVLLLRQTGAEAFFAGSLTMLALDLVEPLRAWLGEPGAGARDSTPHPWELRLERAARNFLSFVDKPPAATSHAGDYVLGLATSRRLELRSKPEARLHLEGFIDMSHADVEALRDRIQARLNPVLGAFRAGCSAAEIAASWSTTCEADLLAADRYCESYEDVGSGPVGVDAAVARVRIDVREGGTRESGTDRAIELAFGVDDNVREQLPIVLESIVANTSSPIRAHVLARGLEPEYLGLLERVFAEQIAFVFCHCDSVSYGEGIHTLAHTTISTLDRLLLPDLLVDVDKIIYLDVDLIVCGDLAELWRLDLADQRLAAKSSSSPRMQYVCQMVHYALARLPSHIACNARRQLYEQYAMLDRAFNAGVLVMNLKRMREENFARRFLPMVESLAMNDQDVLNIYAGAQRMELDAAWNAIPRQDLTDAAKIVHFAGPVKPWGDLYIARGGEFKAYEARYAARIGRFSHA